MRTNVPYNSIECPHTTIYVSSRGVRGLRFKHMQYQMVLSYHSVFRIPFLVFHSCVPFLPCGCTLCIGFLVFWMCIFGSVGLTIFLGISPDIPRYLRHRYPPCPHDIQNSQNRIEFRNLKGTRFPQSFLETKKIIWSRKGLVYLTSATFVRPYNLLDWTTLIFE